MQLKYRYDMEIGNAKRSCIKRITEKDDTSSNKLIILFISDILKKNANMVSLFKSIKLTPIYNILKLLIELHRTKRWMVSYKGSV